MARPEGTTEEYRVAVKTAKNLIRVEDFANKHLMEALDVILNCMRKTNIADTVKIGAAKEILTMYNSFAKIRGYKVIPEDFIDEKKVKEKEEAAGIISLDYTGTDKK